MPRNRLPCRGPNSRRGLPQAPNVRDPLRARPWQPPQIVEVQQPLRDHKSQAFSALTEYLQQRKKIVVVSDVDISVNAGSKSSLLASIVEKLMCRASKFLTFKRRGSQERSLLIDSPTTCPITRSNTILFFTTSGSFLPGRRLQPFTPLWIASPVTAVSFAIIHKPLTVSSKVSLIFTKEPYSSTAQSMRCCASIVDEMSCAFPRASSRLVSGVKRWL